MNLRESKKFTETVANRDEAVCGQLFGVIADSIAERVDRLLYLQSNEFSEHFGSHSGGSVPSKVFVAKEALVVTFLFVISLS